MEQLIYYAVSSGNIISLLVVALIVWLNHKQSKNYDKCITKIVDRVSRVEEIAEKTSIILDKITDVTVKGVEKQ